MESEYQSTENKAGWNASQEIIQTLSHLRNSFVSAMMEEDLKQALGVCRRILDVISGKVEEEKQGKLNIDIYLIEDSLPRAEGTYIHEQRMMYDDFKFRQLVKRCIENLYRKLERLQDKKGYGMRAADDPNLATEMR